VVTIYEPSLYPEQVLRNPIQNNKGYENDTGALFLMDENPYLDQVLDGISS
jgi:hypothetical protein